MHHLTWLFCINGFYCQHLFQKSQEIEESGSDDQLAFEEFVHYLQDYEKDLKLVVKSINKKNAGLWLGTKFHSCLIGVSNVCQQLT